MTARTTLAVALARLTAAASRLSGRGGGTAFPGLLALRLDPGLVQHLARSIPQGTVLISGTNGKTTTAHMMAAICREMGLHPLHNRSGSNLMRGIAGALAEGCALWSSPRFPEAAVGIFEVDEATLPEAGGELRPRVVAIGNLFRDQLDRYGEVDTVAAAWRRAIAALPQEAVLVLNSDDPAVADLGRTAPCQRLYLGLDDKRWGRNTLDATADTTMCPHCGCDLDYTFSYYGHMGHYRCTACGWARPKPQFIATAVDAQGLRGVRSDFITPAGSFSATLRVPGLYNVYNALAAVAAAHALGASLSNIKAGLEKASPVFGRVERLEIQGKGVYLILAKNPAGMNEVLRTLQWEEGPLHLLFLLNDGVADGRDISWIWDVDFEVLRGRVAFLGASGHRAEEMALRLKYARLEDPPKPGPTQDSHQSERLLMERDLERALMQSLERTPSGGVLYVVPTYTAMLEVRQLLVRKGRLEPFWEER